MSCVIDRELNCSPEALIADGGREATPNYGLQTCSTPCLPHVGPLADDLGDHCTRARARRIQVLQAVPGRGGTALEERHRTEVVHGRPDHLGRQISSRTRQSQCEQVLTMTADPAGADSGLGSVRCVLMAQEHLGGLCCCLPVVSG